MSDTLNAPADKLLLSELKKLGGHSAISERCTPYMQEPKTYKYSRTCTNCGDIKTFQLDKRQVAFELFNEQQLNSNCSNCGKSTFNSTFETPELDEQLFNEWATDPELHLMPQDEELIIADEKYLHLILNALDNLELDKHKQDLMMDALCVIVYDNSHEENDSPNLELKETVLNELRKRRDKLEQANEWIMDYIKELVYPQLK
ncbi:MAG: hypothetical protein RIG77_17425 [Cyclobacteriaceae bacterium]